MSADRLRNTSVLVENRLLPSVDGTRLVQVFSRPKGPLLERALIRRPPNDCNWFQRHWDGILIAYC